VFAEATIWLDRVLESMSVQPEHALSVHAVCPSQTQIWPVRSRANNLDSLAAMALMRPSLSMSSQPGQDASSQRRPVYRQICPLPSRITADGAKCVRVP
jgi:hypothetical protein